MEYTHLGRIKASGMYFEGYGDHMDEATEQPEVPTSEDVAAPKVDADSKSTDDNAMSEDDIPPTLPKAN
jgi:hypothetical protein